MSDDNAVELIKRGDARFSKRATLDNLRHEIALNFAPHLASWTSTHQWGEDYAAHLIDGTPLLMARDFIGQIGSMLRPSGKQWFWHRTAHDELNNDRAIREYLDWRSTQMMRIMTDAVTGFHRAVSVGDQFFGLFGDAVITVDTSEFHDSLRLAAWHTKDVVWGIGPENKPDVVTRREEMAARNVKARFRQPKDKLHQKMLEACDKDGGERPFPIRHEVIPADQYDPYMRKAGKAARKDGWISVWVDVENKHVIRETWQRTFKYVIPRWVTLPGNPYAISPATTIALPDARLIQQQALAILEAAEKQVNPPLVATYDTIRGDVSLRGGDITWVDRDYDARNGAPLMPLELAKNFQLGVDSLLRTENQITKAFFLDVLRMPDTRRTKSTAEVQFQIDEYIRAALPLFAPMQAEYNDPLLYEVDAQIDAAGGFSGMDKPQELMKTEFTFGWDNPLTEMLERQKAQRAAELGQLAQAWVALEAAAAQSPALKQVDAAKGFRESAIAIGVSAWLLDEEDAAAAGDAGAQQNAMREMVGAAPNIAQLIDSGVGAAQAASEIPQAAEPSYPMLPAV